MPQSTRTHFKVDTRLLGRQPGAMRTDSRTTPAPADLAAGLTRIPEGAELELDFRLESVLDGVLVTGTVRGPLHGECARCLDPVSDEVSGPFQELFRYLPEESADGVARPDPDGVGGGEDTDYHLEGDWIDLEPVIRDALVLVLPDSPLCEEDCPGLCVQCGAKLAEVGPDHGHEEVIDPRWAALRKLSPSAEDS